MTRLEQLAREDAFTNTPVSDAYDEDLRMNELAYMRGFRAAREMAQRTAERWANNYCSAVEEGHASNHEEWVHNTAHDIADTIAELGDEPSSESSGDKKESP